MADVLLIIQFSKGGMMVLFFFIAILVGLMVSYALKLFEMSYVLRYKRPFFVYTPIFLKKLTDSQKQILIGQFKFYRKLSPKHQSYFDHRVASFIKDKKFVGRAGLVVTEEMRVLISATAVMLTFGFRDYYIGLLENIFIYPDAFYSTTNEQYHKGEFNPKLKTLVLSWKDFKIGFDNDRDKINLGIHEFAHAIHLNSIKERDISSTIFSDSFKELTVLLTQEDQLRKSLIESSYFREYAYTNQFEFVAVIIESFIESPSEFRSQFPQVYDKTKQMLNFNFAGY